MSGPATEPYAVTVLYLSGQVIVKLEERFWLETPGPQREAAIRAHVEQVRAEFLALGSPAALMGTAVRATRAVVMLGSGSPALVLGITQGLAAAPQVGALGVLAAAAGLVPRRWIARAVQPLVRAGLRRLLSRSGRS